MHGTAIKAEEGGAVVVVTDVTETERLERLDTQRNHWQQRLDRFAAERAAILEDPGLADQDKHAAVNELLAERFDERERMRVATLLD